MIAGRFKGRALVVPPGRDTRPTADRVRGAIFNSLGSLGVLEGATVADLFAGSGALGIEALSRGARHCTFVETARPALQALRTNLDRLGLEAADATVLARPVASVLGGLGPVDVAFCDPPYAFAGWSELLAALAAHVVVIESDRAIETGPDQEILKQQQYSGTVVTIVRHGPVSGQVPRES